MTHTTWILSAALAASLGSAACAQTPQDDGLVIVQAQDVTWSPLNPARGDQSPRAGALWGDRTRDEAAGFLVEFREGFASPAHIHNITYRGVVILGLLHNDDPNAADMWMPEGSFWTQPAGEGHVTAASGQTNLAYIEIDEGPYLVQPVDGAFDTGERPINIDASNLVWTPLSAVPDAGLELAFLWGAPDAGETGVMVRLQNGARLTVDADETPSRLIVIEGDITVDSQNTDLSPGGYVGVSEGASANLLCASQTSCLVYARTSTPYQVIRP